MSIYPKISKWRVPSALLHESLSEMSIDGAQGNEGISLWLGIRDEEREVATVSHAVRLRGPGIRKMPAQIQIQPELMHEVHETARGLEKILIGQIHSHGTAYGVKLSYVDITYGISVPFYLSVVAPHYALKAETKWDDCGSHVYVPKKGYVLIASREIITVDNSLPLEVLTVGNA